MPFFIRWPKVFGCLLLALLCLSNPNVSSDQAKFFYDALGRLGAVLNDQGEIALYSYDAVGNLLEISRNQAPTVAPTITAVTPNIIQAGATEVVTITGTNLLLASISTSHQDLKISAPQEFSDSLLTVTMTVPIPTNLGSTDVTVTNVVGSASASLTLAAAPPPVITLIDPDRGGPGSMILIEGRNFSSVTGQTQVAFEGLGGTRIPGTVLNESPAANGTHLRVEAPTGIVSGPVTVTVGSQTSAGVLFTVPTLSSITATAQVGSPADPTQPSTNIGQTNLLHGGWLANGGTVFVPTRDDAGATGTEAVFLSSVSADGTRGVIRTPGTATTGSLTLQGNGSAFLQIVPTVSNFAFQTGETWPPPSPLVITGLGFQEGNTTALFSGTSTPVSVADVLSGNTTLRVAVPAGATEGPITVTTPGGTSQSLLVPRLDSIVATASQGIAANPANPSANIGQTIGLRGAFFSTITTTNLGGVGVVANNGTEAALLLTFRPPSGAISVNGPGTATVQIVPTVSSFVLPPGGTFQAGTDVTIFGSGFKQGVTTVTFSGTPTPVPANGVSSLEDQLTVTIPAGAVLGPFIVSTDEGTSNSLDIPVLQSIVGVAVDGVPTDPALPSGNAGQKLEFHGSGFTATTQVGFPLPGNPTGARVSPLPADVSADGTTMLIAVPFNAISGTVSLTNGVGAADYQVVPTISSVSFPPGTTFQPAVLMSVFGTGFNPASTTVQFTGAAARTTPTGPVTENDAAVIIPADATLGPLTVTTDGGTSSSFDIPVLQSITATAALGMPIDPAIPSANTGQTIQLQGSGFGVSTHVIFATIDGMGAVGTQSVTMNAAVGGATGTVSVPLSAQSGTIMVNGQGTGDLQIVPTLSSLALPPGEPFAEGTVLTLFGTGFIFGSTSIHFPGIASPVPAETIIPTSGLLTVTIPVGATTGPITVSTTGGTSNVLSPPVLLDIVSTAVLGTPADPALASVNAPGSSGSTTIQVLGTGLTNQTQIFFPALDATGVPQVLPATLFNVSSDGTQGFAAVPRTVTTGEVTINGLGSIRLQVVPNLTSFQQEIFKPTAQGVLVGGGFQPQGTTVFLPGVGTPVPALSVTDDNRRLAYTVPAGVTGGMVQVTTSGGTSNPLVPATLQGITGLSSLGTPADPAVASVNVGEILSVQGQGLTTSTELIFATTDAAGLPGRTTASLHTVSPDGLTGQVFVPSAATTGPVTITGLTSILLQIVPTLTSFTLPPGQPLVAGEVLAIQGTGFKEGVTLVQFTGMTALSDAEVSNGNQSLTVPIPQGIVDGSVTVQTDGGTSNSLLVAEPTLQSISTVARIGTPTDPASASSNTSEFQGNLRSIVLQGAGFTTGTQVLFPVISDEGVLSTELVSFSSVDPAGTEGTARVPVHATTGQVTLNGQGSVLLQIVPTLTSFVSGDFQPGQVLTLAGTGFQEGGTSVSFAGVATPVPATDVFSDCGSLTGQCSFTLNNRLSVTVPSGAIDGVVTVITSGGTSNGLTLSGTQLTALLGVAAKGTPADPTQPSANVGQRIQAQGAGFSSSTRLRYPTLQGDGIPGSFTVSMFGIRNGGTLGDVTFGFIPTTGQVSVENGIGSVFLQIVPDIFDIELPPGQPFAPGQTVTIFGRGFTHGETSVNFTGAAGPAPALSLDLDNRVLTVLVPPGANVGPVTVTTNGGTSNEILLPDLQSVVATAAQGVPADPGKPSANPFQVITIQGTGFSDATTVFFTGTDNAGAPVFIERELRRDALSISPDGTEATLRLPPTLVTSGPVTVEGTGNAFLQIVPTIFASSLPTGQPFAPGTILTIQGNGFKEGATTVTFTGIATTVPADDVLSFGTVLFVTIPPGAVEGPVTVTTDGGTSNAGPTLTAIQSQATIGTPADPGVPSANIDQIVHMQGIGFTSSTNVTFPTTSDAGVPGTRTFPNPSAVVSNISADGTTADVRIFPSSNITTGIFRINGLGGALVQIVPTVSGFRLPTGSIFEPGVVLTLFGSGFKEGATTLTFPGVPAPVPSDDVFDQGETLTVTIPPGAVAGDLTLTTDGGSHVIAVGPPRVDSISAQPVAGIPTDPTLTAATVGQLINLHGGGFVSGMEVVFTSTDENGVPETVSQAPFFFQQDGSRVALHVPTLATTGPVTITTGTGSVTLQIVPSNTSVILPPGETVLAPGQTIEIVGSGFKEGVTSVNFPGVTTPTPALDVLNGNGRLSVTVPPGLTPGLLTVTTDGGTSVGHAIP